MTATDELPADLYGRERPDRFIRGLTAFITANQRARLRAAGRHPARVPVAPAVPSSRELVVTSRTVMCDEVVSLRLASPDGTRLPRWLPGAHLRIELPSGRARHYSLCGDPRDTTSYTIAVRRINRGGGGSAEIHDSVMPGTVVRAVGPRNGFPFGAEPVVLFIAGGIGITPLLPMAREAATLGLTWRLVYAGRSRSCMPMLEEVSALGGEILADDETGVPSGADLVGRGPDGAAIYCCGPPAMLEGVRKAAAAAGTVRAFRFERFTAPPIVDGRVFEVELGRSGTVLTVPPDQSALDVLREHDPGVPYSCRQGFCGLCLQHVLRGEVDHRDLRLTDTERADGAMLVCVSRAAEGSRVVLDL
ncbi:MAG TPA: PDR/VanB family oxidoreductase [Streptosporangiaceae bacterium]